MILASSQNLIPHKTCVILSFTKVYPKNFAKVSAGESFCPSALKFFFFFLDLFVFNLRLSLHWNEYHALFYYKFYSIQILFYSIILWLYCDITYASINYAVFKLKKNFQNIKVFQKIKKVKTPTQNSANGRL